MGAVLSVSAPRCRPREHNEALCNVSFKRQKTMANPYDDSPRLIGQLPDEVSIQILARVPRIYHLNLRLVSRKWKATFMNPELFKLRKELGLSEEWLYVLMKVQEKLLWSALDPLSRKWLRLPPLPSAAYKEDMRRGTSGLSLWNILGPNSKIAEAIRSWLSKKEEPEHMPFCGCEISAVNGCLYLLGGFSGSSTMNCVWQFDPILNSWEEMNSMSTGRAYCKAGNLNDKLYVVGGVSRGPAGMIPLQSAEVFDPLTGSWSQVPTMPFSKAQLLPNAFFSDMLKPIATGMITYRGSLFVPQSLYSWPFIVDIGGEIYDPKANSWSEMPSGMGEGWPARQAATKLSVVVDDELYAVDPSSSLDSGKIKVYDHEDDSWKVAIAKVPIHDFTESETPFLLAGFHRKIHVITKDANRKIVVMQADIRNDLSTSPWCSKSVSANEHSSAPAIETETVVWKVVSSGDFGSAELVSCAVIDL